MIWRHYKIRASNSNWKNTTQNSKSINAEIFYKNSKQNWNWSKKKQKILKNNKNTLIDLFTCSKCNCHIIIHNRIWYSLCIERYTFAYTRSGIRNLTAAYAEIRIKFTHIRCDLRTPSVLQCVYLADTWLCKIWIYLRIKKFNFINRLREVKEIDYVTNLKKLCDIISCLSLCKLMPVGKIII